jgi:glycosyltransferase involved in cell wall biosynthesis
MEQEGNHLSLDREMISVVVPAYNEARRISEVLNRIRIFADEMLVVNDGSTDETPEVAEKAGARVIDNKQKKGYIGSIKAGFHEVRGDIIVTIDGDGEHNPEEIPLLTQPIFNGKADMVIGRREKIPRVSERLISLLTRFRTKVIDSGSGFRAMRKDLALRLNLNGKCICGLSVLEARHLGAKVIEVPITINILNKRRKIAWSHLFQLFYVLRWMIKCPL